MTRFVWRFDSDPFRDEDPYGYTATNDADAVACCVRDMMGTERESLREGYQIEIGEMELVDIRRVIDSERVIAALHESAVAVCGDRPVGNWPVLTDSSQQGLTDMLCRYLKATCLIPFWTVVNIRAHTLTAEEITRGLTDAFQLTTSTVPGVV